MNYAKACLGLGQQTEAKQCINMIRSRAGMPIIPISETGQTLVNRYRNESRIELPYEHQRYFDVRHWMIAPNVANNAQKALVLFIHMDQHNQPILQ